MVVLLCVGSVTGRYGVNYVARSSTGKWLRGLKTGHFSHYPVPLVYQETT